MPNSTQNGRWIWTNLKGKPPSISDGTQSSTPFAVRCLEDYHSDVPIHLSFRKDEILQILDCDPRPGWWQAERCLHLDNSKPDSVFIGWTEISASDPEIPSTNSIVDDFSDLVEFNTSASEIEVPSLKQSNPTRNRRVLFVNETGLEDETKLDGATPIVPPDNEPPIFFVGKQFLDRIRLARLKAESNPRRRALLGLNNNTSSETGVSASFNGSEQFSINGGTFNAVSGHIVNETTNSGNRSFFNCIFNTDSRSDIGKKSSSATIPKASEEAL
ncbi:hypothetical protein J3R30DRAFT_3697611 [Lentinula aciculospora]|uniref:SH3 domain-containing protein n=1 Tax=Lentinula aciculospora TaxID=153920 RepID=A0A9W9ANP9_9AGAR|nr:hypothetical protein J3R30DRAFT_3697611 [Lentinula aciculospora]